MPFDVTTLQGITFAENSWFQGGRIVADDSALGGDGTAGLYIQVDDGSTVFPSGSLTVDTATTGFIPGRENPDAPGDPASYILPVYGTFALSIDPTTIYYIHGFNTDGTALFASTSEEATSGSIAGTGNLLILSNVPLPGQMTGPPGLEAFIFYTYDYDNGVPGGFTPICFVKGTLIATIDGPVTVEALSVGDMVITASGAARPVKWIGHMLGRTLFHPRPWEVQPVRVRAHAFGADVPTRDLRLSPGHAAFVDGVLIPVGHLVNGATIIQEDVAEVHYYHVELDSHDLLVAEGLPCESYLDDSNRASFANAGTFAELHGRLDPRSWDDACAPMVAGGPQLVAVQQRLLDQAAALGWERCEEADLLVEADGVAIAPLHRSGNRFWFAPQAANSLTLVSGSGVLAQVMPGIADGRRLGVAVGEIRIDGAILALEDAAFGAGFYPTERHEDHGWRWTNGAARIDRPLSAPAMVEISLTMVAPWWRRPAPPLQAVAA